MAWYNDDVNQFRSAEKDLEELVASIQIHTRPGPYYFFTTATPCPDKMAIEAFKDDGSVIVVDRKQRLWRKGERYERTL